MIRTIMLVPATTNAGLTTVAYGLLDALTSRSVRASVLADFDQANLEELLANNRQDDFLESVVADREKYADNQDVLLIKGVTLDNPYAAELNFALATALSAAIIFIANPSDCAEDVLARQFKIIANPYHRKYQFKIFGTILNKTTPQNLQVIEKKENFFNMVLPIIGKIPYRNEFTAEKSAYYATVNGATISKYLDINWLWPFLNSANIENLTPPVFRHRLIANAGRANKRIVLPEGEEPRTLQAVNICAERHIARCVLLGNKTAILQAAAKINLQLHEQIEIIDPDAVREQYVAPLVELRKSKGLTADEARQQLQDNVVVGTMMLQLGEVDGLVSGAVHTTANTIRPALQIVRTAPGAKLVSSIFFVCLPDQVLVFGDCAINPNPTAEELADIAIQSADSARAFGIIPLVAMLSYSTGTSGAGADVEKVKKATEIAKQLRPDLDIDGPLQYDAAIDKEVAALKAPKSFVAGKANVFIVPDLDVGNIVYKAIQRSTGSVCIGPMLQGLRKPVNDLSRGCLVEDIVYTIAITAVQNKN